MKVLEQGRMGEGEHLTGENFTRLTRSGPQRINVSCVLGTLKETTVAKALSLRLVTLSHMLIPVVSCAMKLLSELLVF